MKNRRSPVKAKPHPAMAEVQQVLLNGKKFLENRRTIVLGVSPGNPHYYNLETLEKLFTLVKDKSDKVRLFIPDKLVEHNYKAVGSKNPEKSARANVNLLRNRCKRVIKEMGCGEGKFSFVNWVEEVEPSPAYVEVLKTVNDLYGRNEKFRFDLQETTKAALTSMKRNRETAPTDMATADIDIEEGVQLIQKELAFLHVLPRIYADCEEFVFVYHLPWPPLEKYFDGVYDGIVKPSIGIVVAH